MLDDIVKFFSKDMVTGIYFLILGHALGWFAGNSQFVWEYWDDKPVLSSVLFGIPAGIAFWYGTRYCFVASENELWSVRFIASAFSYAVFPIMTWYFLGESIFTTKTMICIFLALMILIVQITFK